MPDDAQICSCNNVTKGDICEAISDGCIAIGDLKACTKAGTGCGGCMPLEATVKFAFFDGDQGIGDVYRAWFYLDFKF